MSAVIQANRRGRVLDALELRRRLGRTDWRGPEPMGPDGWRYLHVSGRYSIIVTASTMPGDDTTWVHASRTGPGRTPTWAELQELHHAVWGDDGYSYQIHPPTSAHINIHPHALHLWGRADGAPVLPEFGTILGSI